MGLAQDFSGAAAPMPYTVHIETPRLILREHTPADIDRIHEISQQITYYCFDGSREKAEDFLQEAERTKTPNPQTGLRDNHMLAIVEKSTGALVGHICLERVNYFKGLDYEVNFFMDPACQNKGYGREAAVNIMNYGFTTLGLYAYSVTIHPNNGPSHHVADTEGYQKISDIRMDTIHGEEPRDLLILTRDVFFEKRKHDKRPYILPPGDASAPPSPQP